MSHPEFEARIETLAAALQARDARLATAESCTGGWLAKVCTDAAGSSAWFDRGLVTYSNAAKTDLLGLSPAFIEQHGAVSGEVVSAMATGVLQNGSADYAVSVSGIAGPDGGSDDKPVGTVWIGWCQRGGDPEIYRFVFDGDREAVRAGAVSVALDGLLGLLNPDG